jgi:hypothetical protein
MNAKQVATFELNKKYCLTTLKQDAETGKFYVPIEVDGYFDLMNIVQNQITNAKELLYAMGNDMIENNVFAVYELLNIVSQILPVSEMELLDEIQKQ